MLSCFCSAFFLLIIWPEDIHLVIKSKQVAFRSSLKERIVVDQSRMHHIRSTEYNELTSNLVPISVVVTVVDDEQ